MQNNHSYKKSNSKTPLVIGMTILVAVVSAASFFGGMAYQKKNQQSVANNVSPASENRQLPSEGSFGGRGGQQMGGFGTVAAISESSISVKNSRSGSTTTYSITSSTTISNNGSAASVSEIKTGDTVMVRTSGSDLTAATQIMVNPDFQDRPGGGSPESFMTN